MEGVENDWRRRLVPVQFPPLSDPTYVDRMIRYTETLNPYSLFNSVQRLIHEHDLMNHIVQDGTMPGWSLLRSIGRLIGLPVDHDTLMDIVVIDDSSVEAFREWWSHQTRHANGCALPARVHRSLERHQPELEVASQEWHRLRGFTRSSGSRSVFS